MLLCASETERSTDWHREGPVPAVRAALRLALLCVAAVGALASCSTPPPVVATPTVDWKSELAAYGDWLVVAPYGRVWHPHARSVGQGFVPYLTGGRWAHGSDGWTFESRWAWGKIPFRHGRWFLADDLGWMWSPDNDEAPAWVEWRVGGDCVGWSPIPPVVNNPTARPLPRVWTFVKLRQFTQRELEKYALGAEEVARLQSSTELLPTPASGPTARSGPTVGQVMAAGGLTSDGGVPDLTVPPEPAPTPPALTPADDEEPSPPPPPKKKKKKKKTKHRRRPVRRRPLSRRPR